MKALLIIALFTICSTCVAETVFGLGNFTIDTGTYQPAPNAEVKSGILEWNWASNEITYVFSFILNS